MPTGIAPYPLASGESGTGGSSLITNAQIAPETITGGPGGNIKALTITSGQLAANAAEPEKIKIPTWTLPTSTEKVETPAGFSAFEVGKVNNGEFRTRGTQRTSAAIPAKTIYMLLPEGFRPSANRTGQLTVIAGSTEVSAIVNTLGQVSFEAEIPISTNIDFNGGWYNA